MPACALGHARLRELDMFSRRDFLQVAAATAAIVPGGWTQALAQQRLTQDELLRFDPLGNVTLVHVADIHAQLMPILFREPSANLGVGEVKGLVPHITGQAFLDLYNIKAGSAAAYALTSDDFVALAKSYGRLGGLDRIATILKTIRGERGDRVVFLDGGDTWQNSYTSLVSKGQDMVDCMALLKPDAMVGHWEFTLGAERVKELVGQLQFPFLAQNVRDTEWNEPAFDAMTMIERGGVKIAVIGQALALHADRQPALDDSELVVRHPRERSQAQRREGAQGRRRAGGAAVAQRLRRRPQARRPGRRHRRDPHGAHPRCAARSGQGRQHAAGRLRQPRQVRVAARSRRPRRRREGLPLQADPGVLRCDRARRRGGGEDPHHPRAARGDAARRWSAAPRRCSIAAATSTAPSTT